MNAEAHLRAQGWQGPGTGLRTGSLQRAILTSKKTDLKGLGAKPKESDQWWDNVFSNQLSNITVGLKGEISQINGGVKAAHPVAARNAHRKQFGDKSALEKVFRMGEVLKGSETFIPLAPILLMDTFKDPASKKPKKDKADSKSAEPRNAKSAKGAKSPKVLGDTETTKSQALPSPPSSSSSSLIDDDSHGKSTKGQLKSLSDRTLRKEARRLRREEKEERRAAKAARRDKRRQKKLDKLRKKT